VLETVELTLSGLHELGVGQIVLLGKCYSTKPSVFERLSAGDMIQVSALSHAFDSHAPFDAQYAQHVQTIVAKVKHAILNAAPPSPGVDRPAIVLMDDGGKLLMQVNKLLHGDARLLARSKSHVQLFGVEQTSSGHRVLSEQQAIGEHLHFPVVNVARSFAKLTHESPTIAAFTVPRILHHVEQTRRTLASEGKVWDPTGVLVLGAGFIGRAAAAELAAAAGFACSLYDPFPDQTARAACAAAELPLITEPSELRSLLGKADVVLGCTGGTSLEPEQLRWLNSTALLLSLSSSDRELSAPALRKLAQQYHDCNETVRVELHGKSLFLPFSGFPLTFDDYCASAGEPEEMQLTYSLMCSGVLLGLQRGVSQMGATAVPAPAPTSQTDADGDDGQLRSGFVDLPMDLQERLIQCHQEQGVESAVAKKYVSRL
jgi:S-adenosylhomocysteine hydrolase